MTTELWADNCTGTLSAPAASTSEVLSVATETGIFPVPGEDEVFHIVVNFGAVNAELCEVTANESGAFTLGFPLANDHDPGESVALAITKEGFINLLGESISSSIIEATGDLIVGIGPGTVAVLGIGTAGQILAVGGSDPSGLEYVDPPASLPPFVNAGDLLVGTGDGASEILSIGTEGQNLTVGGSDPSGLEYTTPPEPPPTPKLTLALSDNSATPAVDTDTYNVVDITAQSATITGFVMTGTPNDGDTLRISITGTEAVAFTLGASFEPSTVALPTTTVSTDRLDMGFLWNAADSLWRCVGVA
jgi:hypothetical protein